MEGTTSIKTMNWRMNNDEEESSNISITDLHDM